jgi:hypothetical protein
MILQCTKVRISKISEEKAAARLKSHLKYLQYRQHNWEREQIKGRYFFNRQSDNIDHSWLHQSIIQRPIGSVYYYCLLFSPAHDEPVNDWRYWTRAILRDLENSFEQDLNWYAIVHDEIETPYVHVVVQGMGKHQNNGQVLPVTFNAHDFAYLCERGRAYSQYEQQRFMTEQLRILDQYDITSILLYME